MQNVLDLLGREAALLAVITLLGSGPATLLKGKVAAPVRFALMPIIGLCAGSCIFTTLLAVLPASSTFWLLPVLGLASLAAATVPGRRRRRAAHYSDGKPASSKRRGHPYAMILLVVLAVAAPISIALLEMNSVGPTTFEVYDIDDYLAFQDGAQHQSIHEALVPGTSQTNFVQILYTYLTGAAQEAEISPLAANVNELFDLHATETISADLIAVLVAGGLGIFAAICVALETESWWAAFGGSLLGGAFFMQLFFDGSEGAISGLVVLVPLGVLGVIAARGHRLRYLIPFSICLAGIIDFYPILLEVVACSAGAALALAGLRSLRAHDWRALRAGSAMVGVTLVLTFIFDVVGFGRATKIVVHSLETSFQSVNFPEYHLYPHLIPGWLLQTVGFYSFATTLTPSISAVAAWLVPTALLVVVCLTLRRDSFAVMGLAGIGICVLAGAYQMLHGHCSYCEDRSLLPVAVIAMFLLGLGLARLARERSAFVAGTVALISLLAASSIALSAYNEFCRYTGYGFFLQTPVRQVLNHLPAGHGNVEVEGFGSGSGAAGELPIVYDLVYERTNGRVSLAADQPGVGLAYFGVYPLASPVFRPSYQYVLTRVPGIATARRVLARSSGVALEQRTSPLDVTIDSGVSVPTLPSENPTGSATVVGSLHFVVSGFSRTNPSVTVTFDLPSDISAASLAALHRLGRVTGSTLKVCAVTTGSATIHTVTVSSPALNGTNLTSMAASASRCRSA